MKGDKCSEELMEKRERKRGEGIMHSRWWVLSLLVCEAGEYL
jgi:hypothetical protein